MKMKQVTGQAVRLVLYLARDGGVQTKEAICRETGIPSASFPKIIRRLNFAQLTVVVRGAGYRLSRPAEDISLWEIYKIFEGEFNADTCGICERECRIWKERDCPLRYVMNDISAMFRTALCNTSIASMAEKNDI